MNKIANIVIASVTLGISRACADSITLTCYPTDSASSYNVTYCPEYNYTEIIGSWANSRSRLYKVLGKHSKAHVIYLRTKAEGQTRTVYLAFGYSDSGKDVSSIRAVDKTKPSSPAPEASSAPRNPPQGASSSPPKSEAQLSPDIEAAKKKEEAERKEEAEKQIEKEAERNKEWREKIDEAHAKGLEYAKKGESKWSLIETNNPMTDENDYTVKSTQLNGQGAVAEINGSCKNPGEVVFIAVVNQTHDQEGPIGLPDSDVAYIAGLKRINDSQAFSTHFPKYKFRNELILTTLTMDKQKLEYEDPLETTWRVRAQIETSRGQITMNIPLFDENVQKLVTACSKQYENAKRRAG
jgi:hypothetical protein